MKNVEYISASAGSGKTYTLTHKLADAVRGFSVDKDGNKHPVNRIEPEQVILTTYTVKAATEFREKAKAAMHEAGLHEEAERLDQAMIGTVHSVADAFIHKYWYMLGISPELNVMTDDDKDFFINQSLASLPTEQELKRLNNFSDQFSVGYKYGSGKYGINYEHWQEDLKKIVDYTTNYDIQDYASSEEYSRNIINSFCQEGTHVSVDKGEALKVLNELDALNAQGCQSGESVKRKSKIDKYRHKLKYINYPEIADLRDFILELPKSVYSNDAAAFAHTLDGLWASEEVRDLQLEYVSLLFKFAREWRRKFEEYKRTKHLIDYNDMEKLFYQLLCMPDVAEDISEEYKYLLVDEFQDSSPIQVKIFDKLSEIVDRSVWVGDYKQAIYGFRGADTDLVKAVTEQIGRHGNGCTTNTLDTSYRSYPEIVETCNKVFVPAFTANHTLTAEQVQLKPHKENKEQLHNLRVWPIEGKNKKKGKNKNKGEKTGNLALAYNIACEVKHGKAPKDIAVLALTNADLNALAKALRFYSIPICRDDTEAAVGDETMLITALLSLLVNPRDEYSRAQIALLTVQGYDTAKILDEKLSLIKNDGDKGSYLKDIPLVKELLAKRDTFRLQSVRAVVESIIIELDLYNVVAHWDMPQQSRAALQAIKEAAAAYEDHCLQMTLPATVSGFIAYINDKGITATGDPDGVRLYTYHGSKGLEWDTVILISLDDDPLDPDKLQSRYFYGVQAFHKEGDQPSADNLYPPMTISVLPWIFGSRKKAPKDLVSQITSSDRFKSIKLQRLEESIRLLYVAMSRPVKELILAPSGDNGLRFLDTIYKDTGLETNSDYKSAGRCYPLGISVPFQSEAPSDEELDTGNWRYQTSSEKLIRLKGEPCEEPLRDIQPSSVKTDKAKIGKVLDSDGRLMTITGQPDMAIVGSCIHDIFCVLDRNKTEETAERIIDGYGLTDSLITPSQIINAWDRLEKYLTTHYGESARRYHELPFKQLVNGQIVTGSMDLVWKTANGCVLIDYKTFPGREQLVLTPGNHYAGNYIGQFDCYTHALEAAGEQVIARYVYYPVTGMLIRI